MPKHWHPKEDKFTMAEDIRRLLNEHTNVQSSMPSLKNMTGADLGQLQYALLEIFEPIKPVTA